MIVITNLTNKLKTTVKIGHFHHYKLQITVKICLFRHYKLHTKRKVSPFCQNRYQQ